MKEYYQAADTFPVKLLNQQFGNKIPPLHVQLMPTGNCNMRCSFCNYKNVDRTLEIPLARIKRIMELACSTGCKAVTLTGGEPLLHPEINGILTCLYDFCLAIGIITNGTRIDRVRDWDKISWCRISYSDEQTFDEIITDCDTGYSYVVTSNPNWDNITRVVEFANRHDVLYVRVIVDFYSDISIEAVKNKLSSFANDEKVIYQGHSNLPRGRKRCLVSLLRPVIAADGNIYPCCTIHHKRKTYDESMSMGKAEDLIDIYNNQRYFDGSKCKVCYYDKYNWMLEQKLIDIPHKEFV